MFSLKDQSEWVAVFDTDEFFMPGHRTPDSLGKGEEKRKEIGKIDFLLFICDVEIYSACIFKNLRVFFAIFLFKPDSSFSPPLVGAVKRLVYEKPQIASLFVPNCFFGSKPRVGSSGAVMPRFTFREKTCHVGSYELYAGKHVLVGKSISRPRDFQSLHTAHAVDLKASNFLRELVPEKDLRINHYVCKTKEEQRKRELAGDSWRSKIKEWNLCVEDFVQVHDSEIVDRFGRMMTKK
jgi:hypothetical protein